jgi:hypothetical protein
MSKQNEKDMLAVSPVEGGSRPTVTGETKAAPKRFWAQHKTEAVLRLLRGEDIDTLSRAWISTTKAIPRNRPFLSNFILYIR